MSNEELILERLTRMEAQMNAMNRSWGELAELKTDLGLLMNPAIRLLTDELVEVESGFQLEDFLPLLKRSLRSLKNLTYSLEQLENLIELWQNLEPLLKIGVPTLIHFLDDLEQKGVFRIFNKLMNLGNLQLLDRILDIPQELHLEDCRSCGPFGVVSGLRSPEGKQGLGVLLELTKALSRLKPGPEQAA